VSSQEHDTALVTTAENVTAISKETGLYDVEAAGINELLERHSQEHVMED
jgi:hypothetical protein